IICAIDAQLGRRDEARDVGEERLHRLLRIGDDRKEGVVRDAFAHFAARYKVSDVDGVRILFEGGWGLIRSSNTQPILVMRFEADSAERLAMIRAEVESWLTAQGIDVTPGVGH
ncbi:MAG: phosphomannomutase, partial [Gemmatimonadota bacterium]